MAGAVGRRRVRRKLAVVFLREEDERKGKTMVVAAARGGRWVRVFCAISMGIKERGKWSTALRCGG
jgi:hypothetical protein